MKEALHDFLQQWHDARTTLTVHTSGSTGIPKAIEVEKERMRASARMTAEFLQLQPGDTALLCMPLQYIAGMMMAVRAEVCGLRLTTVPPDGHPLRQIEPQQDITLAAMVPLQVWNTLQVPEERAKLRHIRHLIIGGGAIDTQLEQALQNLYAEHKQEVRSATNGESQEGWNATHTQMQEARSTTNRKKQEARNDAAPTEACPTTDFAAPSTVWSSYGMTETLSHIALRRVASSQSLPLSTWYTPLPGVHLAQDEDGCLLIHAPHLSPTTLHTHDIVTFNESGQFRIKGRSDNVICTGGVKVQIEEVEALLRPVFGDTIQVTSTPHPKFGEIVIYLTTQPLDEHLLRLCLPNPYWLPKRIVLVEQLPRTATGKPDRARAQQLAKRT